MLTQHQPQPEPTWLTILRLLRWDKPAGRLILMVPALWGAFLAAQGLPPAPLVGVIVLGTLATSALGCVMNDFWDRDIDPHVQRTRTRPLASRALTIRTGLLVALIALGCAAVLAFYLTPLSFWLCVAAVPFILFYPLAKRVFPVPQLVLSLTWGFAVLISWSAVTGRLEPPVWLLWGATVLWTLGFDTVYAMSDREDDKRLGVKSSALFFGPRAAEAVGLFYLGAALLLAALGVGLGLGWGFWLSWIVAAIGWGWHYADLRPTRPHPSVYPRLFRQNVWLGFILLGGMIAGALF